MAKNDVAGMVGGAGLLTSIFSKLNTAVAKKGGTAEQLHRLAKPEGDVVIDQMADLIIGRNNSDIVELPVDYEEFRTIRKDRYAFLGDVNTSDVPEVEHYTHTVRFRELEFDHDPLDQEVLDKAEAENCRQPSRAEAETYIRRFTSEQLGKNPRVGLIGPGVRRLGDLHRVYVIGDSDGVDLRWHWTEYRWLRNCRFVVVCKPRTT